VTFVSIKMCKLPRYRIPRVRSTYRIDACHMRSQLRCCRQAGHAVTNEEKYARVFHAGIDTCRRGGISNYYRSALAYPRDIARAQLLMHCGLLAFYLAGIALPRSSLSLRLSSFAFAHSVRYTPLYRVNIAIPGCRKVIHHARRARIIF